jgi:hypothetical protein
MPYLTEIEPRDLDTLKALPFDFPQSMAGGCLGLQIEFRYPQDMPLLEEHVRRGWTVRWDLIHLAALKHFATHR